MAEPFHSRAPITNYHEGVFFSNSAALLHRFEPLLKAGDGGQFNIGTITADF